MYKKLELPNNMIVKVADIFGNYYCTYKGFYIGFSPNGISISISDVGGYIINSYWDNLFSTE